MTVMSIARFERFFRAAAGLNVDKNDLKRYSDFVDAKLYDLLTVAQATAKANGRDIIRTCDLPITKGLRESIHHFRKIDQEVELEPILEQLATHPALDRTPDEETEAAYPDIIGGLGLALAQSFKTLHPDLKNPRPSTGTRLEPSSTSCCEWRPEQRCRPRPTSVSAFCFSAAATTCWLAAGPRPRPGCCRKRFRSVSRPRPRRVPAGCWTRPLCGLRGSARSPTGWCRQPIPMPGRSGQAPVLQADQPTARVSESSDRGGSYSKGSSKAHGQERVRRVRGAAAG